MSSNQKRSLTLNRETVRTLTSKEMTRIAGGDGSTKPCVSLGCSDCATACKCNPTSHGVIAPMAAARVVRA